MLRNHWPSYSGDYTGRRYSSLTQIDKETVRNLSLAWTAEMNYSVRASGFSAFGGGSNVITHVGGRCAGAACLPLRTASLDAPGPRFVIPAEAGIHSGEYFAARGFWIPASAGMTGSFSGFCRVSEVSRRPY